MDAPKVTHALEDYLKAIYQLSEEVRPVIAARIAAETGVSPSTIFATLRRLAKEGYVTINRRKEIHLTDKGKKVAENIVRRHFLTERFLTDLLGLDWVKAHQEAHRLEHAISQEVEERLAAFRLQVAPEKTDVLLYDGNLLIAHERLALKPATFTFLGFIHFLTNTSTGKVNTARQPSPKSGE